MAYKDKEQEREYRRKYAKQYRINNPQYIKTYQKTHKEEIAIRMRIYYDTNKNKVRSDTLKRRYGIDVEQQKQMYISQNGVCAICGKKFKNGKDMHVDHNHVTGKIRQLLCNRCNFLIGNANEDIFILSNAIAYLQKWK